MQNRSSSCGVRRFAFARPALLARLSLIASFIVGTVITTRADDPPPVVQELVGLAPAKSRTTAELAEAYEQALQYLTPEMSIDDVVRREAAFRTFEQICMRAARPGAESDRVALVNTTLKRLSPETAVVARVWVLRQLQWIGAEECVEPLAKLLTESDAAVRDAARRALEKNGSPKATKALAAAYASATDAELRLALLNSLAARRAAECEADFVAAAQDKDAALARVGIAALADLATPSAITVLENVAKNADGVVQRASHEALLRVAGTIMPRDAATSKRLYEALLTAEPAVIQLGALRGLCRVEGATGVDRVLRYLSSATDTPTRRRAAAIAAELSEADTTARLTQALTGAKPEAQSALLEALEMRKDTSATPAVVALLRSDSAEVRLAALSTLKTIGDASAVNALTERAASSDEAERDLARLALQRLRGAEVDRALIAFAQSEGAAAGRGEALRALAERHCDEAKPLFEHCLSDANADIRRGACAALDKVGVSANLAAIAQALQSEKDDGCRETAEDAIASITLREPESEERTAPLIAALAQSEAATQASLLRVLGRVQGVAALSAIRQKLNSTEPVVRDAAIRSLCKWENPAAIDDLLQLSNTAQGADLALSLRAVARLVKKDDKRSDSDRLGILQRVFHHAPSDDERKLVLGALAALQSRDALSSALMVVSMPELRDEAALAAVAIARNLAVAYPTDSQDAVKELRNSGAGEAVTKKLDEFERLIAEFNGSIGVWNWAGPFVDGDKKPRELFDEVFQPEKTPDSAAGVEWKPLAAHVDGNPWIYDFTLLDHAGNRCAYARTIVHSDKDQPAKLEIGSDDCVKVWLNGEVVHSNPAFRAVKRAEDTAKIQLRAGANPLLIKIVQSDGGWGFTIAVKDENGAPLPGLRFSTE